MTESDKMAQMPGTLKLRSGIWNYDVQETFKLDHLVRTPSGRSLRFFQADRKVCRMKCRLPDTGDITEGVINKALRRPTWRDVPALGKGVIRFIPLGAPEAERWGHSIIGRQSGVDGNYGTILVERPMFEMRNDELLEIDKVAEWLNGQPRAPAP